MDPQVLAGLIEQEDVTALLRLVDALAGDRSWESMAAVAAACRAAVERGRQLWPVAMHIDYRVALEAPAGYAATVLETGASRFALGPLTEVVASTHTWEDLRAHVAGRHLAALVAQERVLRGERLDGDGVAAQSAEILELPLHLVPGEDEVHGTLPTYRAATAEFPHPEPPAGRFVEVAPSAATAALPGAIGDSAWPYPRGVWGDLVETWLSESEGVVGSTVVAGGDPAGAVGLLAGAARFAPITPASAAARLTWAGASGGAHGRRRGGASGRFLAWWTMAAVSGVEWPIAALPSEDLVAWFWWEPLPRPSGWFLGLAAVHVDGWATAACASDSAGAVVDGVRG